MRRFVPALACVLAIPAFALAYPPATVTDITQTSVKIGGLDCGTRYRIRIEERNAANTAWESSTIHTPTTAACAPPPPTPRPSGEPAPIAGQGYRKVFEDNFDTYNQTKWKPAHYLANPPADSIWAANGVLNLASRRSQGFPEVQLTTRGDSHNGPNNWTFRYGYMEARLKGTAGPGSWPAFWTIGNDAQWGVYCPPTHGEIDPMDGLGPAHNQAHIGIHSNSWGNCKPDVVVVADPVVPNWTTQFVTFAAKWTPTRIDFYANDQLIGGWNLSGGLVDVNSGDHNLHIKSACGGWTTGCTAQSPNEILTQFDFVRVWQQQRIGNG
jgi:beta-glucanase (GH16 family)